MYGILTTSLKKCMESYLLISKCMESYQKYLIKKVTNIARCKRDVTPRGQKIQITLSFLSVST
jgi:hypothetical protein